MSGPPLECRAVDAGHAGNGAPTRVLSGVSFAVHASERLVVLGRSGSGKSTLLRLLNRLEEPLAGKVLFHGRPLPEIDPLALRRKVALVLQTPVAFEGTVRDNLLTRPRHTPAPEDARLSALLRDVGLTQDFLERPAELLSVGEKQRMCLARALVSEPEVLLLDEPTSALDPKSLGIVADLVLGLADLHSLSVVVATHQPDLVRRLGGSVLLLEGGAARLGSDADITAFLEGG